MEHVEVVVIGAGVIGLAVARELAQSGLNTLVVDGEATFGTWTSSRNSEVIHAGIYYSQGTLKERLCTAGREMLYAFCADKGVPHRRTGKLIFSNLPEQSTSLDMIMDRGKAAGVHDLIRIDGNEVLSLEPALRCHEAILSPSTGIIDSHAYMLALLGDAEAAGATFVAQTSISHLAKHAKGWSVYMRGEGGPVITAGRIVNAAGLTAHVLAHAIEGLGAETVPQVRFARGVYFNYGPVPFRRLIYPVPVPGGLGTHLTLDMAGSGRFGPDVEWIDEADYHVDPTRGASFLAAARLIWPDIDASRLTPGYAGIRPKLSGPEDPAADFAIQGAEVHGLQGLVNLFGIESPGLTASLAIAQLVKERLLA